MTRSMELMAAEDDLWKLREDLSNKQGNRRFWINQLDINEKEIKLRRARLEFSKDFRPGEAPALEEQLKVFLGQRETILKRIRLENKRIKELKPRVRDKAREYGAMKGELHRQLNRGYMAFWDKQHMLSREEDKDDF